MQRPAAFSVLAIAALTGASLAQTMKVSPHRGLFIRALWTARRSVLTKPVVGPSFRDLGARGVPCTLQVPYRRT